MRLPCVMLEGIALDHPFFFQGRWYRHVSPTYARRLRWWECWHWAVVVWDCWHRTVVGHDPEPPSKTPTA